jgi:hypothetical protein
VSATINFHGPYVYKPRRVPPGKVESSPEGYVEFGISVPGGNYLYLYIQDREQADLLVKAALAARDLLPEPTEGGAE